MLGGRESKIDEARDSRLLGMRVVPGSLLSLTLVADLRRWTGEEFRVGRDQFDVVKLGPRFATNVAAKTEVLRLES